MQFSSREKENAKIAIARSALLRWPRSRLRGSGRHPSCFTPLLPRRPIHSASARKISNGGRLATPRLAISPIATVSKLTDATVTSSGHGDGA
jgi:hypothetical protein